MKIGPDPFLGSKFIPHQSVLLGIQGYQHHLTLEQIYILYGTWFGVNNLEIHSIHVHNVKSFDILVIKELIEIFPF
jgi:hypothetical protein